MPALVQKHLKPVPLPAVCNLGDAVDQALHTGMQFGEESLNGILVGTGEGLCLDL